MKLALMPVGSTVHNVELRPGGGGCMVRSAGTSATLLAKQENGYALLRMPSGEQRLVHLQCSATIGTVGNKEHKNRKLGKAGISRHLGAQPKLRPALRSQHWEVLRTARLKFAFADVCALALAAGRRPHVRGVAMNPVDHPHGGGEGRTSGGRPSCSPWAVPTKGFRTRNNPRTDKFRISRRAK